MIKGHYFLHFTAIILAVLMMSCTLYRSPDAVVEDKSRAIDLYLFAKNTESPEYYDAALSYAVIPAAYFQKGEHSLQKSDWQSARGYYSSAIEYSSNYGIALSRLEYLSYMKQEGLIESESLDTNKPGEKESNASSGIITSSSYPFSEETAVQEGFDAFPLRGVDYHLEKARLLYQHRLYEEALEELRMVIENYEYKESSGPYILLLNIHHAERNERKAQNVIQLMTSLFPEDDEMYFQSALYYIDRGNYEQAIQFLHYAIDIEQYDPRYFNNLGICYRKTGKNRQAEKKYREAITIDSEFADAYLNLGVLYETVYQDLDKAREYYEKYLELNGPRSNVVQQWLEDMS